jgi:hypothetical protein
MARDDGLLLAVMLHDIDGGKTSAFGYWVIGRGVILSIYLALPATQDPAFRIDHRKPSLSGHKGVARWEF